MVKSCTKVLYDVEVHKFNDKMKEVFARRNMEREKKLEELKERNANLPRSSSAVVFKDRKFRMKQMKKNSIFNVKKLFSTAPKKNNQVRRRMTRNQYFKLMSYIKQKRKENLSKGVKDRYETEDRPEFNHFKKRHNREAWEDYSYNPKTTLMLTRRIKSSMKAYSGKDKEEKRRLFDLGKKLKQNLIK